MNGIKCRLCGINSATSAEHIVPNSLGGKRVTTGFICAKCNNNKGKEIDAPLEELLRPLSLLIGAYRGDGQPVADIHNLESTEQKTLTLTHGGKPRTRGVSVSTAADGSQHTISLSGENEDQMALRLAHELRRLNLTPDLIRIDQSHASHLYSPPGMVGFHLQSDERHSRSIAKSALAALVLEFGPSFLSSEAFFPVIRFVRGESDVGHGWNSAAPTEIRTWSEAVLGQHILAVFTDPRCGKLMTYFVAFGAIAFYVTLTDQEPTIPHAICHIVDPLQKTHAVKHLPSPSITQDRNDIDVLKKNLEELLSYAYQIADQRWPADVAQSATEAISQITAEGGEISAEAINEAVEETMSHVAFRMTGEVQKRDHKFLDRIILKATTFYEQLAKADKKKVP